MKHKKIIEEHSPFTKKTIITIRGGKIVVIKPLRENNEHT